MHVIHENKVTIIDMNKMIKIFRENDLYRPKIIYGVYGRHQFSHYRGNYSC
jgi:hypothetical protein